MTDPGLNSRLRQRSRRAGLVVGLSMAATIAICIGGFAAAYGFLTPILSDIVPIPTPEVAEEVAAPAGGQVAQASEATEAPGVAAPAETPPPPTPTPEPEPPTPTPDAFEPTHQISATESVNFRTGGSREADVIETLPPATALQFLDEREGTDVTDDQPGWMKFRTEDNLEGWVREIDTEPFRP